MSSFSPVPVQLDVEWLVPGRKGVCTKEIGSCHWNLENIPTTIIIFGIRDLEDAILCQETLSNVDKSVSETNISVVVFHRGS